MRRLILGTAGHIDHGKTALVRALTGIDTDRLPEEKRRGITIDIGFAHLECDDGTSIGIVDVPGHEAFVRNMLAGATGLDLALLVIAADEGVMPQTREHLAILALLGVHSLTVVLTKADLVDDAWLELVREEVDELLQPTPFAGAPILATSTVDRRGLDTLLDSIAKAARQSTERDAGDLFRMPIDRVFTVRGTGTVVTGTIWSGRVDRDATLRVLPADETVRVRAVQSHGRERDHARAGERAALALAGSSRTDLGRGDTLVASPGWTASATVTVRVHALDGAEPIRARQRVRFHLGTVEVLGRIALLEPGPIAPAASAWAQVRLEKPIVARAGDRFVLRAYSPVTTIGGGLVAEPDAQRRKRASTELLEALRQVLEAEPAAALGAAADIADWAGLAIERIPIATPIPAARVDDAIARAPVSRIGSHVFHDRVIERAQSIVLDAVDAFHAREPLAAGFPREELRQTLPANAPATLADAVIDRLTAEHRIARDGHTVRRASFQPRLTPDQAAAAAELEALHERAGLAAPAPDEIEPPLGSRPDLLDLIHFLQRSGRLVAIPQGRSLHPRLLRDAVDLARQRFAGRSDLSPADFRELFGISRKFLIPLLEHLDRSGITRRDGDSRRLER